MSARSAFKQADLTRVLRAADRAGVGVRVEIETNRMIVTTTGEKRGRTGNAFDELFA